MYVESDPFRPLFSLNGQSELPRKPRKYPAIMEGFTKCRHKQPVYSFLCWLTSVTADLSHVFSYVCLSASTLWWQPFHIRGRLIYCNSHWNQSRHSIGHDKFIQRVHVQILCLQSVSLKFKRWSLKQLTTSHSSMEV